MLNGSNEVSAEDMRSARQKVFDPMEDNVAETLISSLSATIRNLSPDLSGPGAAFLENVAGTIHTVSLLYNTLFGNLLMERYGQFQQERCKEAEARLQRTLTEKEKIKIRESALSDLDSLDNVELVKKWTLRRVNLIWDQSIIAPTGPQVLKQGVVLLWSAFEVLCNDLLIAAGDTRSNLRSRIEASEYLNQKRGITKSDSCSPQLWPQGKDNISLRSLDSISKAYQELFPDVGTSVVLNKSIFTWFADRQLSVLEQRRHLIVHRAGVKDKAYREQSGDTGGIKDILEVSPSDFLSYTKTVIDIGTKILEAVNAES